MQSRRRAQPEQKADSEQYDLFEHRVGEPAKRPRVDVTWKDWQSQAPHTGVNTLSGSMPRKGPVPLSRAQLRARASA